MATCDTSPRGSHSSSGAPTSDCLEAAEWVWPATWTSPPTVLELAGITDDNSFAGHSLLQPQSKNRSTLMVRMENFALEDEKHTGYFPKEADPMLFGATDWTHQNDIASNHPDVITRFQKLVHRPVARNGLRHRVQQSGLQHNRNHPINPNRCRFLARGINYPLHCFHKSPRSIVHPRCPS